MLGDLVFSYGTIVGLQNLSQTDSSFLVRIRKDIYKSRATKDSRFQNLENIFPTFSAALKVLRMESLMSLARELTFDEGSQLGQQLGVKPEQLQRFKETAEKDPVGANFQILCHWRGR